MKVQGSEFRGSGFRGSDVLDSGFKIQWIKVDGVVKNPEAPSPLTGEGRGEGE
jgi:hypothetical protein